METGNTTDAYNTEMNKSYTIKDENVSDMLDSGCYIEFHSISLICLLR